MSPASHILLVEDEVDLAEGIADNLRAEGHDVVVAHDGESGLQAAQDGSLDLVILDVMLPGIDGFEVCRRLRTANVRVPVLFLTARSDPADRIRGLEEGGDDYLAKPFHLRELLLRVSAILRRARVGEDASGVDAVVRFGGNEVDLRTYEALAHDGQRHRLTHKELSILRLLSEREGQVVPREDILDAVWGGEATPTARTIDNFILRLRRRFEPDPQNPRHFHSVHGVGYRFVREGHDGGA